MEVVSRKQAIEAGLIRYFTGGACKNGHVAERNTIRGSCVMCDAGYLKRHKQRILDRRAEVAASSGEPK